MDRAVVVYAFALEKSKSAKVFVGEKSDEQGKIYIEKKRCKGGESSWEYCNCTTNLCIYDRFLCS